MKDIIKRWNQLAGTEKKLTEQKETQEQNLYGNQFIKDIRFMQRRIRDAVATKYGKCEVLAVYWEKL